MLYLIGLGIELKDLSLKALECVKKCDKIYLESYTSTGANLEDLKKLINKDIIISYRDKIENDSSEILEEAKKIDISILVYGDPLIATTHINYIIEAKKLNVKVKVIHNISVINSITETGLMLYNFGKITSIPFDNKNILAPIEILNNNLKIGLHTLFLLDLDPKNNKFLTINEALSYLIRNKFNNNCVTCCALGTGKQEIRYGKIKDLIKLNFNNFPQCLIIPGKLHFMEEEALELWKI